jgi:cytochrome c1
MKEIQVMQQRKLFAVLTLASLIAVSAPSLARDHRNGKETGFIVRVENISSKDGQAASDGTRWPFALSPGLWVSYDKDVMLFKEGKPASKGLEMQAEDGDPNGLVKMLEARNHTGHGVFNTPIGATAPGPIRPGDAYEFTVTAKPGMKLMMTMMFGQSNDWFYAPDKGIELFDKSGKPVGGDVTSKFLLCDAGTEKDEELGIGPNQGPRQKGLNTGEDEHGVIHKAKDSQFFTRNAELFRVTITPEEKM